MFLMLQLFFLLSIIMNLELSFIKVLQVYSKFIFDIFSILESISLLEFGHTII